VIPSQSVVTGPVCGSPGPSRRTSVLHAPVLVGEIQYEVEVEVAPSEASPSARPLYSTHWALQVTADAPGPVVGP
jgi:hypothetical protein